MFGVIIVAIVGITLRSESLSLPDLREGDRNRYVSSKTCSCRLISDRFVVTRIRRRRTGDLLITREGELRGSLAYHLLLVIEDEDQKGSQFLKLQRRGADYGFLDSRTERASLFF